MRMGEAASRGAATIVNAIACGKGAAFGISLEADARIQLEAGDGPIDVDGPKEGESLVMGCIRAAASATKAGPVRGRAVIRSDIPISKGLKSSSAVSNIVVLAALRAIGKDLKDDALLNIAIDESIQAGVTVTGAYDDAAACHFGGLVVTDNRSRTIIKRGAVDPELAVLIQVPEGRIAKSSVEPARFAERIDDFENALSLVVKGEYPEAMALNSRATARALDLSDEAPAAARKAGAFAAGITGTGPASVALCRRDRIKEVEKALSAFDGGVIHASLNSTPSREVVPRLL
ncbi:MAG TPA: shikimate kinase [Thermoplasmata archaeon]|nr:shikimate kinase [Thermoplasmata archaeon]